jgi:hypothetical protein
LLFLHFHLLRQSLVHHLIDHFVQKNRYCLPNHQSHLPQQLLFLGYHLQPHLHLLNQQQLKFLPRH